MRLEKWLTSYKHLLLFQRKQVPSLHTAQFATPTSGNLKSPSGLRVQVHTYPPNNKNKSLKTTECICFTPVVDNIDCHLTANKPPGMSVSISR